MFHWFRSRRDEAILASLRRLECGLAAAEEHIMKAVEEVRTFVAKLDTYTNAIASEEQAQTDAITALAAKVDEALGGGTLDAETSALLTHASETLAGIAAKSAAQTAAIRAIGADPADPLPRL